MVLKLPYFAESPYPVASKVSVAPTPVCVCVYSFPSQVQESQAIQPRAKRKVMVLMLPSIPRITLPGSI